MPLNFKKCYISYCYHSSAFISTPILMIFIQSVYDHKILAKFDYGLNWIILPRVMGPWLTKFAIFQLVCTLAPSFLHQSLWYLYRMCITINHTPGSSWCHPIVTWPTDLLSWFWSYINEIWTMHTVLHVDFNFDIGWPWAWPTDLLSCFWSYSIDIWTIWIVLHADFNFDVVRPWLWPFDLLSCP